MNPPSSETGIAEFIKISCSQTKHPELCVSSLSSYDGSLKPTLGELAMAALNVSLLEVRTTSDWAAGLKTRSGNISEGERAALENCVQNLQDTTDQLHVSLAGLKRLRRKAFDSQMDEVSSGMNSVFTNQDSCVHGLNNVNSEVKTMVAARLKNVHALLTTALDLVNELAVIGLRENETDV